MKRAFVKLWGMPLLMAVLLLYGLIAALVRDGLWDAIACIFLLIPVLVVLRYYFR